MPRATLQFSSRVNDSKTYLELASGIELAHFVDAFVKMSSSGAPISFLQKWMSKCIGSSDAFVMVDSEHFDEKVFCILANVIPKSAANLKKVF